MVKLFHLIPKDFKKPECLLALSWALLKDDFDLDVEMPLDRLIPTVPLRLNYILWLEDLLSSAGERQIRGIDIGKPVVMVQINVMTKNISELKTNNRCLFAVKKKNK